tara:strand:+ start:876 stop:1064 length:189 start_codon:yes stop_codon:yes gene_type:complete
MVKLSENKFISGPHLFSGLSSSEISSILRSDDGADDLTLVLIPCENQTNFQVAILDFDFKDN